MRLKALASEFIGTAFLLAGVVGSGIMAEGLSDDVGVVLLANAAATAGVLLVIIYMFGPVSGAHFNPVVTLAEATLGDRRWAEVAPYIVAQLAGGVVGTIVANLMFDLDAVNVSTKARDGSHLWLAEVVATYGLVLVVFMLVRSGRVQLVAGAVAAYIGAAYWFTASTSFANPAVTAARTLSDTFAGIEPASAPMFVVMQLIGAALAVATVRLLYPRAGSLSDAPARTPKRSLMTEVGFAAFDADNHYYEATDAFIRHVDPRMHKRCMQWATVDGRERLLVAGRINRFHRRGLAAWLAQWRFSGAKVCPRGTISTPRSEYGWRPRR